MLSTLWESFIFYWTLEKLQSALLGVRETWLSIDAGLWLWFITSVQIYCRSGYVCLTDVWGMLIGASTANTGLRTDRWDTEKLASAGLFRVKSWPAEGSGSSGLGSEELKGFFVTGERSKCSVLAPWQCLKLLPKSCRSLGRNLEDANKTPQKWKEPREHALFLDASPLPALLLWSCPPGCPRSDSGSSSVE